MAHHKLLDKQRYHSYRCNIFHGLKGIHLFLDVFLGQLALEGHVKFHSKVFKSDITVKDMRHVHAVEKVACGLRRVIVTQVYREGYRHRKIAFSGRHLIADRKHPKCSQIARQRDLQFFCPRKYLRGRHADLGKLQLIVWKFKSA